MGVKSQRQKYIKYNVPYSASIQWCCKHSTGLACLSCLYGSTFTYCAPCISKYWEHSDTQWQGKTRHRADNGLTWQTISQQKPVCFNVFCTNSTCKISSNFYKDLALPFNLTCIWSKIAHQINRYQHLPMPFLYSYVYEVECNFNKEHYPTLKNIYVCLQAYVQCL